jgi:hypothetical protein
MYDVYLFTGVRALPSLESLKNTIPAFEAKDMLAVFQERIQQRTPHFLHLDLSAENAIEVFQLLRTEKATGYILPATYRQPRISVEEATPLAAAALVELQAARSSDPPIVPLHFVREQPVCWTFNITYSGNSRVYVHVDKLDGHIWQKQDLEHTWEISYFLGHRARKSHVPYSVPPFPDNLQQTYDIYLVRGATQLPALDDLIDTAPERQEPALQQQMTQRQMQLLQIALPAEKALGLLRRLEVEGAWGSLLSSAYRHPQISLEQAAPIAEEAILERQAAQRPADTLGPLRFFREEPCCWTFGAPSEQFIREGRIPGLVFASVDKLDGHVWKSEEFERFLGDN